MKSKTDCIFFFQGMWGLKESTGVGDLVGIL